MLPASRERISALGDSRLVLDVGGWAKPISRADWVIDLMPYETRGLYGETDPDPERFGADTWVERDICDHEPWPFEDDQFDFAICSQTLEDVRDPVWVCAEMDRVARAGYVEVPSRLEEQAHGVHGNWVGWAHHHWLVDVFPGRVDFVFKTGILADRPQYCLNAEEAERLTAEERVQAMFWEDSLEARERIFLEPDELESYLAEAVAGRETVGRGDDRRRRRWRR